MFCIKCGVELADSEKKCPLCGTVVFNPEMSRPDGAPPYPRERDINPKNVNRSGLLFVITMLFLLPIVTVFLCDWTINRRVLWSGYVIGAVLLLYIIAILPLWFRAPNPVIFIPVSFAAIAVYLLYINFATGGHWFLSFALPIVGGAGLIVTAAAALIKYVRRGYLFIFGGTLILAGAYNVLIEFLLNFTFDIHSKLMWSIYPLCICAILGIMLIVIGSSRTLRESLHKKFFL